MNKTDYENPAEPDNVGHIEIGLLKLIAGSDKDRAKVSPKLTSPLFAYLQKYQCERYLCIYYNVDSLTHLEFNMLPEFLHIPSPVPIGKTEPCFITAKNTKECSKKCGSNRCNPPHSLYTGHDGGTIEKVKSRFEELSLDGKNFWLEYELFLHYKFDPFKSTEPIKKVINTDLFGTLQRKESQGFFSKYKMFKGEDSWFDSRDENGFKLSVFNQQNGLTSDEFYGCYLIPPEKNHAALLLAYCKPFEESVEEEEARKAAELLGFISQFCWPSLNREIVRDMEKVSREKVEAERAKEERERSHQMLMLLQRPLDALTRAFDEVQAEAQEMQAIINDPVDGLFKAHKQLAEMYRDDHEIKISEYVSFTCHHEYVYEENGKNREELQLAYCFAMCSIFGLKGKLMAAQINQGAIAAARESLKDARKKGADIFHDLLDKLGLILDWKKLEIEETLIKERTESEGDAAKRFSGYLMALKRVCFTPFKAYSKKWPHAPVALALDQEKIGNEGNDLPPMHTPFAQHAILTFILAMKKQIKECEVIAFVPKGDDKGNLEYCITLNKLFYDAKLDDAQGSLRECIASSIRFGTGGRNVGNFLGTFQGLLRHGLGVKSFPASAGDWVYLTSPPQGGDESTHLLMALGKLSSGFSGKELNVANTACYCDRYFFIVQCAEKSNYVMRLIWTNKVDDWNNLAKNLPQVSKESESPPPAALPIGNFIHTTNLAIKVVDHDGSWVSVLGKWAEYESLSIEIKSEIAPSNWKDAGEPCAVILHTSERRSNWSAKLNNDKNVKVVIVVSAGGIANLEGFEINEKWKVFDSNPEQTKGFLEGKKLLQLTRPL